MKAVKMQVTDKVSAQDIKKHLMSLGYDFGNVGPTDASYYFAGKNGFDHVTYDYDKWYFEAHTNEEIFLPVEESVQISDKSVVSDGLSTSYYQLTITNKAGESINCEMGDVIRCVVGDNFSLGNVYKAARRMYEASQGRGKKGVGMKYDANKIAYFSQEFADFYEDGV